MPRFIIIVLDGYGIGAMDDVPEVRPADIGANTCRSVFEAVPELRLPALERLGLMNAAGLETDRMKISREALYGKSKLAHFWADTFFGHQEILGTKPKLPKGQCFADIKDKTRAALEEKGFRVGPYKTEGGEILIVESAVTVADNIECDPLQAINVTAAIDYIDFERVLEIGRTVRGCSTAPRVIAFGGRGVSLEDLLNAVELPDSGLVGVNAPKSGVYNRDYHCVHMGYGVDPTVQVPHILGQAGIDVFLLGKVADIAANEYGRSFSIVDTDEVLDKTIECAGTSDNCFICANVQETDLCGHRQNPIEYAKILVKADAGIERLLGELKVDDILIVMADHGNDPLIGHPHHTREYVPLLIYSGGKTGNIGVRDTLSDVGATATEYFKCRHPENGTSFLDLIT